MSSILYQKISIIDNLLNDAGFSIDSFKEKRTIRGINIVSRNYSDGFSNFMLDFSTAMNKYTRVAIEDFSNKIDYRTNAHKQRLETMKSKSQICSLVEKYSLL